VRRFGIGLALAVAAFVGVVVFLWPAGGTGSEPIRHGEDTCARCRMLISQPGFAGEMRDHTGALTRYDDLGCLLGAMLASHEEIPEAWVEDHDSGALIPLLGAQLVRADAAATPMGHGLVAFADAGSAHAFVAAHGGELVRLEDLVRSPERLARARGEERR
jgi:hypothetical protein